MRNKPLPGMMKHSPLKQDELSPRQYEKLLRKMGGDSSSDTLVVGQSMDQNIANKKANINYRQANPRGHTSDSLTKYNKKEDKYTTYKVGPK
tara:strand:- start:320 stop:595 length:276 start_codon:yes stop_codon:yes gene_type:complete